jgi:hypothetical protein
MRLSVPIDFPAGAAKLGWKLEVVGGTAIGAGITLQ